MEDQDEFPLQYLAVGPDGPDWPFSESEPAGMRSRPDPEPVYEASRFKQQLVEREAQLRALTAALLQAEERERRRIAQGLHDQIGHDLALIKRKLGALEEAARAVGIEQHLEEIQNLVNQAIQTSRSLIFELSSPVLYELGLDAALQSLGEQLAQQHDLRFHFEADSRPGPAGSGVYPMLYRVIRELLFNVVKHARAHNVTLSVSRREDNLRLIVADDGVGFDPAGAGQGFDEGGGFGLFSIRQQLDHVGGCLEIDSASGCGTRVVVVVPLARVLSTQGESASERP